jgi:hypothetical protein
MWISDFANDCFLDSDVSEIPILTVLETAEYALAFGIFQQYCFESSYDNNQLFLQVSLTQIVIKLSVSNRNFLCKHKSVVIERENPKYYISACEQFLAKRF